MLALTLLPLLSCGGVPKTHYYSLRLPSAPATVDPQTPFILGVEHFRSAQVLRDDRIVYYESPVQMNYYEYHRRSSDPPTLLTEQAVRALRQMGVFLEVRILPTPEPLDYLLRGRVNNFEEVDDSSGGKGRVALELWLLRSRDHKVVWNATREVESAIQEAGVPGVVKALNASSERILKDVLSGLAAQVEKDFKASQGPSQ
ncbi:MAG TPA: ABC-type transport auxiliary lipoprotein family protein [Terriglobia bacterium]|nr:ABC-type transport auxiliary lipoprotein family protein [Terriglobia bacterium]